MAAKRQRAISEPRSSMIDAEAVRRSLIDLCCGFVGFVSALLAMALAKRIKTR